MRRLIATVLTLLLVVTFVTSGTAEAAPGVPPAGFQPSSVSWQDANRGWVLGFVPCDRGSCAALVRTWDGGATWWPTPVPDLPAPSAGPRAVVYFADGRHGLLTDGTRLFTTRTSGLRWRRVTPPVSDPSPRVRRLAVTSDAFLAVVSTSSSTLLLSSPRWVDRWSPVAGVALPARGHGDIATRGRVAHVALTSVHRANGYWVRAADGTWRERQAPCSVDSETDLALAGATPYALCSTDPGMGYMDKDLHRGEHDGTFTHLGSAPDLGITTGFAMAARSTAVVGAVGLGAAFLHRATVSGNTATWQTSVTTPGLPWRDLQFTDDGAGLVLRGGPRSSEAEVYRTEDAGRTWTPLGL